MEWAKWFYGQRMYGMGYIPEDALARAVAQRDAISGSTGEFTLQSTRPKAISPDLWTSLGPTGINSVMGDVVSGRVTSLAIDPRNPATVYVAAAGGGVWKSLNRGDLWVPITDSLPSLASGAVAVDPFTSEVWYGTGELNFCRDCYYGAGVYRSGDGGANWTRIAPETFLSSPTSVIVFDPRRQGTTFIGRSTALWKSSDGGGSWRVTLRGAVTDLLLHPLDGTIAYAAIGNFSGSPENGIYRSADGGETWTPLSAGLPPQATMGRIALAVSPASPSTLYALIVRADDFNLNGLFRSLDGGDSWERLPSVPETLFFEAGRGQGLFNLLVEVDPGNPSVLYVGGIDLWKSTDQGSSWRNLSELAGLHEDQRDLVFDPSGSQIFYLLNDSGVWRTSDRGGTFASLNQTLAVTQFQTVGLHPSNPNLAVGGTQDNGTVLFTGGFAWNQGRAGDSGAAFYGASDPGTLYTVANRISVRRSDDGGQTFQVINEGIDPFDRVQFYPPFLENPGQPGTFYLATQRLWESSNRGDHWEAISGDLTGGGSAAISALAVAPGAPQTLYAGTSDGRVHVSGDSGRNWSPAAALPNRFVTSIAVSPVTPLQAYVGLSGFGTGHVFRTRSGGEDWEDISGNLPDIPVNALLVDGAAGETLYAGTDIGMFVLREGGNWEALQEGMPNAIVLGLSLNPATRVLVAATHGRSAFARTLGAEDTTAPWIGAILNSAGFGQGALAPGMLASLFGSNLGSENISFAQVPLPLELAGVSISVNGIPAPQFFASPGQLNFQVPYGILEPFAEVAVRTPAGEASVRVPQAQASPGVFGNAGQANIFHGDGSLVTQSSPALPGEEVVLFASGLGAVEPGVESGSLAPFGPLAFTVLQPVVTAGGLPAEVRFSGLSPGLVGIYQVNFAVPAGVSGAVPVVVQMAGAGSGDVTLHVAP